MKIYTTVEPVPSRMLAVARLLLTTGPMPEDELIPLLQPREKTGMATNTLNAALECGLVIREKKQCRLAAGLFEKEPKPTELDAVLPLVLARLLLAPEIGSNSNKFATLCAWLLHQPVLTIPVNRGGLKTAIEEQGLLLEELDVKSDARWDNVIYWARYLGLVRQMRDEPCAGLIPDPTLFLRQHLPKLLPAGEEVDASTFRQRVGALCPVLDGGAVRNVLLARIAPDWPDQRLSDALSFGIERLEQSKELSAFSPDDKRAFLLTPTGRKIGYLTRTR